MQAIVHRRNPAVPENSQNPRKNAGPQAGVVRPIILVPGRGC
jgi:hypothetical protein